MILHALEFFELTELVSLMLKVPSLAKTIGSMINAWDIVSRPPPVVLPNLVQSSESKQKGVMVDHHWLWALCGGALNMGGTCSRQQRGSS